MEVYLKNDSYEVYKFYNVADTLRCVSRISLSLAVLDVMLPDMDGFALCQKIRERYLFPIIMLTAKWDRIRLLSGMRL